MSRKVLASSHPPCSRKIIIPSPTHDFHTSHSFPPAELHRGISSGKTIASHCRTPGYAYKSRVKSGTTSTRRGARSRNNCERTRSRASSLAARRTWREARRQVTGRRGELTERPRHVRRRRDYRRARADSAALGRLRRAGVGRAVYPWRHIIRVNTK